MSLLSQVNEKHFKMLKEEEEENTSTSGSSTGGSRKNNNDEDSFTTLLNTYAKLKSKYDQYYKTLNQDQIQTYKESFKKQEEELSKSYNLLKNKKSKYYCGNYTIELCKKENRMRLTNITHGKILFKFFRSSLKDKPKDEVNKYVFDIINFVEKERINNKTLYIKCNQKRDVDYNVET
mgnify:CR=1 FL=1